MMTPFRSERTLAYLYSIGGFASLLQVICTAIIWLHWRIGNIFVFIKHICTTHAFLIASPEHLRWEFSELQLVLR